MLQVRRDLDFGEKPLDAKHGPELGVEDLDGDAALVFDVARQIHRRHAPASDLAIDLVAVADGFYQLLETERHGGSACRRGGVHVAALSTRCAATSQDVLTGIAKCWYQLHLGRRPPISR